MFIRKINKSLSQFISLSLSNYLLVILTFVVSIFMTHTLSVNDFGEYRYILAIITLLVTIFNFGIHYSSSRLIAIQTDKSNEKTLIGTTIVIMILIYLGIVLGVILYSLLMNLLSNPINIAIIYAGLLMFTLFFQRFLTTIMKGNNQVRDIIIQNTIPQVIIVCSYIYIYIYIGSIDLLVALNVFLTAYLLTHIFTFIRLKAFNKKSLRRQNFKAILEENKENGFQIYKGSLASVAINDVLTVIVGGIISKSLFGFFSLSLSMASPISMIPRVMGIITFKKNAIRKKMPKSNIVVTFVTSILGALFINVGVHILFPYIYDNSYEPALDFLLLLSITALIHGFGDYFNQFLGAHGLGKVLKKASYYSGAGLLIFALILVPFFDIYGLIYARLISSSIYFIGMIVSYKRHTS